MNVKVETKCGRCGKKHEATVSLEKAQGMVAEAQRKADALKIINEFAGTLNPELHPEVILIHKEAGVYTVHVLDNLCSKADAKRNKGCASRVSALVKEAFTPPKEPKARAPRKVKEKESAATGNGPGKGKGK